MEPLLNLAFVALIFSGILLEYSILDYCYCMAFHKFDDDEDEMSTRLDISQKGVQR